MAKGGHGNNTYAI